MPYLIFCQGSSNLQPLKSNLDYNRSFLCMCKSFFKIQSKKQKQNPEKQKMQSCDRKITSNSNETTVILLKQLSPLVSYGTIYSLGQLCTCQQDYISYRSGNIYYLALTDPIQNIVCESERQLWMCKGKSDSPFSKSKCQKLGFS